MAIPFIKQKLFRFLFYKDVQEFHLQGFRCWERSEESPSQMFKKGGLTGLQLLEGVAGKEGVTFFWWGWVI